MATKRNGYRSKKVIDWVDKHQMIKTDKYGSHHFTRYGENAFFPFSQFISIEIFGYEKAFHNSFSYF